MTLGERVLILRRRHRMSQHDLAKASGLNVNTLARIEQGIIKNPGGDGIAHLAQALGTTTDYLLGLSDESGVDSRMQAAGMDMSATNAIPADPVSLVSATTAPEYTQFVEAEKQ